MGRPLSLLHHSFAPVHKGAEHRWNKIAADLPGWLPSRFTVPPGACPKSPPAGPYFHIDDNS